MNDSLSEAFATHHRSVFGVAYRMLGDASDADDVVQDTFHRLVATPPEDLSLSLEPWLIKVAVNISRDVLRKRSKSRVRGEWLPSLVPTEELISRETPESRLDHVESIRYAFLHAAESLTPTQRAVFVLRAVFEFSVAETAQALELTEGSVKSNLHRARLSLQARATGPTRSVDYDLISEFLVAVAKRDHSAVAKLLDREIRTFADGGQHFFAAKPLVGLERVTRLLKGLSANYSELNLEVIESNGEIAIIGRAERAPRGWASNFALIPETKGGKITALRNQMDIGKLGRVVRPKHALLVGCTGMLAGTLEHVLEWAEQVTIVSRSSAASDFPTANVVEGDWSAPDRLFERLTEATKNCGAFDMAILWIHEDGEACWPLLGPLLTETARVYEVLGSATAVDFEAIPDHAANLPGVSHRRVILGRAEAADRWLTWDEISSGVWGLVRRDRAGLVGR